MLKPTERFFSSPTMASSSASVYGIGAPWLV
jgi:hypothetical protein